MKHKHLFHFCIIAYLIIGCNTTNSNDEPDNIFGYWKLDRIVYESGEVLRPGDGDITPPEPEEELYWLGFRDIDVEAEGEFHKKLTGGAYCNWADGWFTEKSERELDVTLICSRLICGIATEFCRAVTTSTGYTFSNRKLVLKFNSQIDGSGYIQLNSFNPTNGDSL